MTSYPDTSFLCALYRRQDNTEAALAQRNTLRHGLPVTTLLLFEFRQSVRFQTWLHRQDATKGYGGKEGAKMLADFQTDLESGLGESACHRRAPLRATHWAGRAAGV